MSSLCGEFFIVKYKGYCGFIPKCANYQKVQFYKLFESAIIFVVNKYLELRGNIMTSNKDIEYFID